MTDTGRKEPLYYNIGKVPEQTELMERFLFPFSQLNYLLGGGVMDRITLIVSGTDNGKTTFASQILIDVIKQGYKAFAFFGEDGGLEAANRLYKQFTPFCDEDYVYMRYKQGETETNVGEWHLKPHAWRRAKKFFDDNLFLYNNNLPADKRNLIETLEAARKDQGCRVFLLDNVEMFDLDTENENKGIKEICIALRQYAISKKVHIIIVAHTRKMERDVIRPDVQDVKGTSSLTNIAKNIVTIVRTDKLDKTSKGYENYKKILNLNGYDLDDADCVLEVRKTKGKGIGFVALSYHEQTNRFWQHKKSTTFDDTVRSKVEQPKYRQTSIDDLEPINESELDEPLPF